MVRLAAYLQKHDIDAVWYDPNLHLVTGEGDDLETVIFGRDWDIIGFSCLDETLPTDMQNMHIAASLKPDAIIVAGGIEAQFNYQTILDKTPARMVILGEGEIPMLMLAQGKPWQDIPGLIFKNPAQPLTKEIFNDATPAIPW